MVNGVIECHSVEVQQRVGLLLHGKGQAQWFVQNVDGFGE